jgi:hypothetical protein
MLFSFMSGSVIPDDFKSIPVASPELSLSIILINGLERCLVIPIVLSMRHGPPVKQLQPAKMQLYVFLKPRCLA